MENINTPYDKIALYLAKKLSDTERALVESWINESVANKALFNELKNELTYIDEKESVIIDSKKVWGNIQSHILSTSSQYTKSSSRGLILRVASIAASVALLVGVFSSLFIKSTIDNINREEFITVIETPSGQKTKMTLPDHTQVWLNSESKLSYTNNFNKDKREIYLEGEAYFEVTKNTHKDFIVNTSDVKVLVTGTSFEVSAYQDDQYINVSLVEGYVNIMDINDRLLSGLEANEMIKVNRSNMQFALTRKLKNVFPLWTKEELVFYNEDLFTLARKIERWYGVEIKLMNPIINQKYTFSVKTESLRELLDSFNKITPIDYSINGKEVTISCK
ncbi:MAG: FecR family protein [Prevotella sp.]|jgi:ferric-dicitrate binding protein FerR (iron transport regulator)|nr:FecR family protein [Prevotella sp.]